MTVPTRNAKRPAQRRNACESNFGMRGHGHLHSLQVLPGAAPSAIAAMPVPLTWLPWLSLTTTCIDAVATLQYPEATRDTDEEVVLPEMLMVPKLESLVH